MKQIKIAIVALTLTSPATAEEDQSFSLWDLFSEMEQMAEDTMPLMQDWMDRLGPQLEALGDRIGDFSQYEAPEVLPNGDIIIRRKLGPPAKGETDI